MVNFLLKLLRFKKEYFVSYNFSDDNNSFGFGDAVIEVRGKISDSIDELREKLQDSVKKDKGLENAEIILLFFKRV